MVPVTRVVSGKIQYFPVAKLIFTKDIGKGISPTSQEINEVRRRFNQLVANFDQNNRNYQSGFIKNNSSLPYNSAVSFIQTKEHLIVNFLKSFNSPILVMYNLKTKCIQNYIDFESAKVILNNDYFNDMQENFQISHNLNYLYKNIPDFNQFIADYKNILEEHRNEDEVGGYDCIEIEL